MRTSDGVTLCLRIERNLNILQMQISIVKPNAYDTLSAADRSFDIRRSRLA